MHWQRCCDESFLAAPAARAKCTGHMLVYLLAFLTDEGRMRIAAFPLKHCITYTSEMHVLDSRHACTVHQLERIRLVSQAKGDVCRYK